MLQPTTGGPLRGKGLWDRAARMRAAREHGEVRDAVTFYPFTSQAVVRSGIARVTLVGELDLDTAPFVREAVAECLAKQPTSLCLDLTGISFCDCAGLNALLTVRISALQAGVDLYVEGVGTQVARLLSLIGADDIFTEGNTPANATPARSPSDTIATGRDAAVAIDKSPLRDLLA
ncbi:STAS domain-containing protein [Streptomyces sp. NBC_01283]|uniref:STAS domain-containing protein n=1 Tax=Streptomyces sp. NBC_01283 TaxID=2903812 RepID=UPI00352F7193